MWKERPVLRTDLNSVGFVLFVALLLCHLREKNKCSGFQSLITFHWQIKPTLSGTVVYSGERERTFTVRGIIDTCQDVSHPVETGHPSVSVSCD